MMTTRDASKRTTEITQVRRGTTVDALPHEHSNLEVDTLTDSKPVELSQDRSDVSIVALRNTKRSTDDQRTTLDDYLFSPSPHYSVECEWTVRPAIQPNRIRIEYSVQH